MSNFTRSRSLKSIHGKHVLHKKRPNTWTYTKRVSLRRHTISPRISKWCQKRISTKSNNSSNGSYIFHQRQTIGTISTLTTNSDTVTFKTRKLIKEKNIFNTQSTLFLFGFLWFPCWWIGGYYLKLELDDLNREEKQVMTIHPSLIANGKTCSKIFWVTSTSQIMDQSKIDIISLFHQWNKVMSLVSVVLVTLMIILLIWYYMAYCN